MLQQQTEIITKGMLLAGVGFMLIMARDHDSRINALIMKGSPIHDFIGLIIIFFSASYLVFLIPECSCHHRHRLLHLDKPAWRKEGIISGNLSDHNLRLV